MAHRRSRRLALLAACLPLAAGASCPLFPGEKDLDFKLVDERTMELRRRGDAQAAPLCALELGCRVTRAPRTVAYVLRPGSILLGDIAALRLWFSDGQTLLCPVSQIRVPQ